MSKAFLGAWAVVGLVAFGCGSADSTAPADMGASRYSSAGSAGSMASETPVPSLGSAGSSSSGIAAPVDTTGAAGGGGASAGAAGSTGVSGASGMLGTGGAPVQAQPATSLTAGMWDDNANYDVFIKYTRNEQQIFPATLPLFDLQTTDAARAASTQRHPYTAIDIALVMDATGSMADELTYLQNEFLGISTAVGARFPAADVRWSLVVYRDIGDEYVTRGFEFTNAVASFRANLAAQVAAGGGDTPEAVPQAFQTALGQEWRGASAAQMLFWVADAPHHDEATTAMKDAIGAAKSRGIRVYPVAASGANPLAEATMRVAAQLTGGRYIFLTDDSGVGGGHSEPKVPCYYVTTFSDAIVRSVAMELTGEYVAPAPASIVRVEGQPVGPTCAQTATVDAGSEAMAVSL